jgi:hypothetical protein
MMSEYVVVNHSEVVTVKPVGKVRWAAHGGPKSRLQQLFIDEQGVEYWRDVPTVDMHEMET